MPSPGYLPVPHADEWGARATVTPLHECGDRMSLIAVAALLFFQDRH